MNPLQSITTLQVEVWVDKPSFIAILDVDSAGAIRVLFPSQFQKKRIISMGIFLSIKKSFGQTPLRLRTKQDLYGTLENQKVGIPCMFLLLQMR